MLFQYRSNGTARVVVIRTDRVGSDWIARAFLLPLSPGQSEAVLLRGPTRTVLEFRCPGQEEAANRLAFVLQNVYGCTSLQ